MRNGCSGRLPNEALKLSRRFAPRSLTPVRYHALEGLGRAYWWKVCVQADPHRGAESYVDPINHRPGDQMRRVRYQVACSLDGYIAGPNGEYDWIVMDPEIDFQSITDDFDALLMGRRTFEGMTEIFPGMDVVVFSRSLRQEDHPEVRIVNDKAKQVIEDLRQRPGKDIWLFGGGELFRSLLEMDCVDTVEPAIIPIVLGGGRPLLPAPATRRTLALTGQRIYRTSGIVALTYDVVREAILGSQQPEDDAKH